MEDPPHPRWLGFFLVGLFFFAGPGPASGLLRAPVGPSLNPEALLPPPSVAISMATDSSLVLDSNAPCSAGPRAIYVSFRVRSTSGAAQTNLRATLSGFAGGITLSGGQAATQFIGTLPAGATRTLYWFLTYPCTFGVSANLVVTVDDGAGGSTTGTGRVTTRSMISSQAGGNLQWGVMGPGAVVGQVIFADISYSFGGAAAGDTYRMQSAGNTGYNAGCFQQVGSQVLTSAVTAIPAGTADTQFFMAATSQPGSGYAVTMRFYFKYLCAGVASYIYPYASMRSGGGNLKYSGNWGSIIGPTFPAASNPFTLTKTATPTKSATGGAVTYTVSITNASIYTTSLDSIADALPPGASYIGLGAGSDVSVANSSSTPPPGATGTVLWRGIPLTSYSFAPGATLRLVYQTQLPATPAAYVNTASAFAGTTLVASATARVDVGSADVAVGKSGPASAAYGDTLRYVLTLSNSGPTSAENVVLSDTLPVGVTFLSASRGGTAVGRVVTWPAVPSLAMGGTVVDTVRVLVALSSGTLVNVAAATATTLDPSAANNNGSGAGSRTSTTLSLAVEVTPKGLATPVQRLPGSGYSQVFTVTNRASSTRTYDLLARVGDATPFLVLDSLRGPGLTPTPRSDSVRVTLSAGAALQVTFWYSVPQGPGAVAVDYLRARYPADTLVRSEGWAEVRRVSPAITLLKSVSTTTPMPGADLVYTLDVANAGDYAAESVVVSDLLPAEVDFKVGSAATPTLPAGVTATPGYSSDGGTTWTYAPVSAGCGAPAGYDRCVNRLRWTLSSSLPPGAVPSATRLRFAVRVR